MRKFIKVLSVVTTLVSLSSFLLLFQSCQEEDYLHIKSESCFVKLNHGDYHKIQAESLSNIAYQSENEYVAKMNDNYGTIRANYVGSTRIKLTNESGIENYVNVDVLPESKLYPEPNISFGDTKYNVKSKLGTPDQENTTAFFYTDYSEKAPYLLVMFEYGQVSSYAVLVPYWYSSELVDVFLEERYKLVDYTDVSNGYYGMFGTYINALNISESTKAVSVSIYNDNYTDYYYMVAYLRNPNSRTTDYNNLFKMTLSTMLK